MEVLVKTTLALLLLIQVLSGDKDEKLLILVEDSTNDMQLGHFNYSIEILKGTICSEFTTHGGVLLSGLKLLQRIITSEVEARPLNYALICQRCIRECSIVKHMLQSKQELLIQQEKVEPSQ